jgi:UDP-glucose 4-epimerase
MGKNRVLITGGAGFIGTNLVHYLAGRDGFETIVLDNVSIGQLSPRFPAGITLLREDFTDPKVLAATLDGVDAVVHLAALSGVVDSIDDPAPSFEINVAGSFRLLEAARRAGVRSVIVASTGGALLGEVPPPISETMAPSPLSPYGATKLALEGYCSAFAGAYGMACAALRFSNIYGPHSSHKKSAVAAFIKHAIRGEQLIVYGDGTQRRDYLYVGDLVRAIETVILQEVTGTYQLGSGKPTSLLELIAGLETAGRRKLAVVHQPRRQGEVHSTWCNIAKAAQAFDYAAPTSLETGLRATWDWFEANKALWSRQTATVPSD